MMRILAACALLLALPLCTRAEDSPKETVIRLHVHAAPAPKPALRYLLLPDLSEMSPGNPVQGFMKCFFEQNQLFHNKETYEQRQKWHDMPLRDLPIDKLRGYGAAAVTQANYAARLDTPDWQTLSKLRADGINLLLPEVQQMRLLASVLQTRLRGEIADRRFDDALVTAKTLFALARLLGEHPTLIGDLVGVAIASIGTETIQEMLQQPGAPNLYWALAELPQPFIDLRKGLQGERLLVMNEIRQLDEKEPMSEQQLEKFVDHFSKQFGNVLKLQDLRNWVAARSKDQAFVQAARKRLAERGLALERFPATQVVLLYGRLRYEIARDDAMKGSSLPIWQMKTAAGAPRADMEDLPFLTMVSDFKRVRLAQARVDQRFGLLRCIEAFRIYAAEHSGKLPKQFSDIDLPTPIDPFTGQPFRYYLEGETGHLRGVPPPGLEGNAYYNVRFEVTIAK